MNAKSPDDQPKGLAPRTYPKRQSAVLEAAEALRRDAIACKEGELLGAEDDLVERYGVSRPTLRLAAALIAQENLLKVKRGVGGGYFASRPDSRVVAHIAAIYLRTRETRVSEVIRSVEPIRVELAKLAAASENETVREEMRRFVAREREVTDGEHAYREFLRSEREFGSLLGKMAGNGVISLFQLILFHFSGMLGRDEDIYINRPARVEEYRGMRNRLAEAVIEGDAQMAAVAAQRCAQKASEWLLEDLGSQSSKSAFMHLAGTAG